MSFLGNTRSLNDLIWNHNLTVNFNIINNFLQIRNHLLAIFDVEGVLYDGEYLPILAEKLNKED